MRYDNDPTQAVRYLQRALQLDPANLSIIASAAVLQQALGRLDESIALYEYIIARDPVNPTGHYNLGWIYRAAGRWDDAIASCETTLRLSPGYIRAPYAIVTSLLFKGDADTALAATQTDPFEPHHLLGLVMAHHALGQSEASNKALAELIKKYESSWIYDIASVLAYRGEASRAFEWLGKAVQYSDPGLSEVSVEPAFTNIHSDTRWLPFLESIGYAPSQLNLIEFEVTLP